MRGVLFLLNDGGWPFTSRTVVFYPLALSFQLAEIASAERHFTVLTIP